MIFMKYNTSIPVVDFNGQEFKMDNHVVTFNTLLYLTVTTPVPGDAQTTIESRMSLYNLASKIRDNLELEISAEEVALLKKRAVAVVSSVIMFGRLIEFLENPLGPLEDKK